MAIDNQELGIIMEKSAAIFQENLPSDQYPFFVKFTIPSTRNEGRIRILQNRGSKESYTIESLAVRQGTDRAYSNFLYEGSIQAVKQWFEDTKNLETLRESLANLSEKVDDYFD